MRQAEESSPVACRDVTSLVSGEIMEGGTADRLSTRGGLDLEHSNYPQENVHSRSATSRPLPLLAEKLHSGSDAVLPGDNLAPPEAVYVSNDCNSSIGPGEGRPKNN